MRTRFLESTANRLVDYNGAALGPADGSIWLVGMPLGLEWSYRRN